MLRSFFVTAVPSIIDSGTFESGKMNASRIMNLITLCSCQFYREFLSLSLFLDATEILERQVLVQKYITILSVISLRSEYLWKYPSLSHLRLFAITIYFKSFQPNDDQGTSVSNIFKSTTHLHHLGMFPLPINSTVSMAHQCFKRSPNITVINSYIWNGFNRRYTGLIIVGARSLPGFSSAAPRMTESAMADRNRGPRLFSEAHRVAAVRSHARSDMHAHEWRGSLRIWLPGRIDATHPTPGPRYFCRISGSITRNYSGN